MANTNFPISLDAFEDPQGSTLLNGGGNANLSHATQHKHLNAAIAALQQAVGTIGSSDVNSLRYQLQNVITTPGPQGNTGPVGPTGPAGTISVDNSVIGSYAMLIMLTAGSSPFALPYGTTISLSSYYIASSGSFSFSGSYYPSVVLASSVLAGTWKSRGITNSSGYYATSSSTANLGIPFLAQRVA